MLDVMPYRSLLLALAVVAGAVPSVSGTVLAQQATPLPSTSPSPDPDPSGVPTEGPMTHDDAVPSPEPASGRSLAGTLMSVKGTIATVKLANGTVQTYTVTTKTAALLKKSLGKKGLFRVVGHVLDVVPH